MGMKFLKAGATATEAVEAALRILEDKEITNAGYGSNLSIDGTVECDATIVDHLGRSGACGAVPNIRNPISLAKLILDTSSQPLSLRRVPPNALVGEGARAFAEEYGMVICANEYLVSKNSRDRFFRWQEDLLRAEERFQEPRVTSSSQPMPTSCVPCQFENTTALDTHQEFPRDHTAAIIAGTWNEGQPDSPYAGTPAPDSTKMQDGTLSASLRSPPLPLNLASNCSQPPASRSHLGSTTLMDIRETTPSSRPKQQDRYIDNSKKSQNMSEKIRRKAPDGLISHNTSSFRDGSSSPKQRPRAEEQLLKPNESLSKFVDLHSVKRPLSMEVRPTETDEPIAKRQVRLDSRDMDMITDTIGAIAIDDQGRIAAGSSSGGIGMKHRGRLGPAALVGIGTAVVPCAEDDEDGVTVAAVTSGTGEHMATTMASQRCAERIYQGTRRVPGGGDVQDDDEDAVMESFIAQDFMNHPGVKSCNSQGAIGIMVVKKCRTGYYLYFAHNTDSFALASMGGLEKEPRCTMSRLPDGAKIAKGGRKIRIS
ncbi:hypothetical protein QQS21_009359 [Conoideocrella luteorostrata]|uniref:Threonine aspartase n=1 Tax=Conoideocrella luteorostrata TaxID=1105319 RepID=A0AAJ0CI12_9HYPO|nr:hypothetical protein QQS21_009359 [Conoideocrella luteorostrata]